MQGGIAATSAMPALRQSTNRRNAATRLLLVIRPAMAITGTTGSGPMIGTSTSGISAPVP
jgi:hypothetical protein